MVANATEVPSCLESYVNVLSKVVESTLACSNLRTHLFTPIPVNIGSSKHDDQSVTLQLVNEGDRKFRLHIAAKLFSLSREVLPFEHRRIAVADYLLRNFCGAIATLSSSGNRIPIIPPTFDQYVLSRSYINLSAKDGAVTVEFKVLKQSVADARSFFINSLPSLIEEWISCSNTSSPAATAHWQCVEDQITLRKMISTNGVAFISDGSILPRAGGSDDRALSGDNVVPFISPLSLRAEFVLPHSGKITGMLVPKGVTVITGGGYHGKSTILNAIKVGIYDKVLGDGREFVVTNSTAVAIRSEDGRYVAGVDISPFIDNLPVVAKIDPRFFSTNSASGSTSMAANVIEAMEFDPELFLLDEDTCASNFMIRDSRMRSMIANEPITPFIYRVNSLYKEKGISTIVVIGGSGDWFDVQDTTIMMDNYNCLDVSKKARSICKTFCTGRVQFNGRGLVHQLPWPSPSETESEITGYNKTVETSDMSTELYSEKTVRKVRRMMASVALPINFEENGFVTASEDGHSVVYRSYSCVHTDCTWAGAGGDEGVLGVKRKDRESSDEDRKEKAIHRPRSNSIDYCQTEGGDRNNLRVEKIMTVDLSKVEQRVSSREGALGMALATIFVKSIVAEVRPVCTAGSEIVSSSLSLEVDGTKVVMNRWEKESQDRDNRLSVILQRFDNLRRSWGNVCTVDPDAKSTGRASSTPSESQSNNSTVTEGENCLSDLERARSIHARLMGHQDFIWPRMYEAAASVNRLRGTEFFMHTNP